MDVFFDWPGERRIGRDPADEPAIGHQAGGLSARAADTVRLVQLDWAGLMARLAAGHGARRIMGRSVAATDSGSGSFSPAIADELARWRAEAEELARWQAEACAQSPAPSPRVNLDAKAHGKLPRIIGRIDAGEDRCRVRGLP